MNKNRYNINTSKDIIEREHNKDNNVIYIYKNGKFYNVFNHSAMLFNLHINSKYKIQTHNIKYLGNKPLLKIGFPDNVFDKIFVSADVTYVNENCFYIKTDFTESPETYKCWEENILSFNNNVTQEKQKEASISVIDASKNNIIQMIKEFPIEQKTFKDIFSFVCDLKEKCSKIKI